MREPEPWIPGTTSYAGLAISLDPHDPGLDTFWEGNVDISILGPEGHRVTCAISLASGNGTELLSKRIATFDLPVAAGAWQRKLGQFLQDEDCAWAYLEATSGRLVIRGDELGEYVLRLERDVKPVRWVCRSNHRITTVRLIDDTGRDDAALCNFYSLGRPAAPLHLNAENSLGGLQMEPPGGLFVARHGEHLDSIIVSPPQIKSGFQGLVIEPDLRDLDSSAVQVKHVLELLRLWSEARLVGPLVSLRRTRVVERLINRLYSRLCGDKWGRAEVAYLSKPQSAMALQQLEQSVGGLQGFPVILRRDYEKMEGSTGLGTQWYAEVAKRYKVCSDRRLCEFALRLASQPHQLLSIPEVALDRLLRQIKDKTVLLRGARFLALLAANKNPDSAVSPLPRWKR